MKITDYNDLSILTDRFVPEKFYGTTFYELVKSFLGKEGLSIQHNTVNNWMNKIDPENITTKSYSTFNITSEQNFIEFDTNNRYFTIYLNDAIFPNNKYKVYNNGTYIERIDGLNFENGDVIKIEYYSDEYLQFLNHYAPILSEILKTNISLGSDNAYQTLQAAYKIVDNKGRPDVYNYLVGLILQTSADESGSYTYVDENENLAYSKRDLKISEPFYDTTPWYCGESTFKYEISSVLVSPDDVFPTTEYVLSTFLPYSESLDISIFKVNFDEGTGYYETYNETGTLLVPNVDYVVSESDGFYEFTFSCSLDYKDALIIKRYYTTEEIASSNVGSSIGVALPKSYEKGYIVFDTDSVDSLGTNIEEFTYLVSGSFNENTFKQYLMPINHPLGWQVQFELFSALDMVDLYTKKDDVISWYDSYEFTGDAFDFQNLSETHDDILVTSTITWSTDDFEGGVDTYGYSGTYYVGGNWITINDQRIIILNSIPIAGDERFILTSTGALNKYNYSDSLIIE